MSLESRLICFRSILIAILCIVICLFINTTIDKLDNQDKKIDKLQTQINELRKDN